MATTEKGIYYPDDYTKPADVPEDMKKLAESVDTVVSNLDTNKVDKVDGKGLSTNDYTNEDKAKLDSLENYDDTEIKQDIEDIQANDAKQDELIQKLKDNCINVTTEEATQLQVKDASTLPAKLDVRGNHSQKTREGYNIWDYLSAVLSSAGGLTIEKDYENGYITVNGMPSKDYVSIVSTAYITNLLEDGQRYTLWQENYQNEETAGIYLQVARTDDNGTTRYYSLSNSATFLVDKSNNASYSIILQTSTVANTKTLSNYKNRYMLYKGTEDKTYELPGTSPSLDYPSEVRAVGDNVNILPNNAVSTSHNGVNYTINEDGSIYAVGTATSNSQVILAGQMSSTEEIMKLRKGVQYKNVGNVDIIYRDTNLDYARLQEGNILTVDENVSVGCFYLQVNSGTTVDETYYPKLVEYYEGMDESYSPYGQGSVEVKKINSNIMPILELGSYWKYTEKGIQNIEGNSGHTITYFNLKKGQTIKVGFKLFSKPTVSTSFTGYIDGAENTNLNLTNINNFNLNQVYTRTYTATKDCKFGYVMWGNSNTSIFEFQLWANLENAEDYQQYEEQSYILDIQKPMLLGDYFVKEADGWKEVHGWNKNTYDETDNFSVFVTDDVFQFYLPTTISQNTTLLCNMFIQKNDWISTSVVVSSNSQLYFLVKKGEYGFTSDLTAEQALTKFKEIIATNNIVLYNATNTPTKLPCKEAQSNVLDQLNELELFKGTNNIITAESLALMQMQYIADTQSYIDSKLNNINQQILELAGGN